MVTAHLMVQASMVTIQIITESRPLETLLGKSSVTEDFFPRPSDDLFTHHAADPLGLDRVGASSTTLLMHDKTWSWCATTASHGCDGDA
jgi:hypothetical protein